MYLLWRLILVAEQDQRQRNYALSLFHRKPWHAGDQIPEKRLEVV